MAEGKATFEKPYFQQIVHMQLSNAMNLNNYLNDQSVLALCMNIYENPLLTFGSIPAKVETEEVLWEKNSEWNYLPCLIEVTDLHVNWQKIQPHLTDLESQGFTIGKLIATFLVTDQETDYYQAWIEYK